MKSIFAYFFSSIIVGMGTLHADDNSVYTHALVKVATACMRDNPSHSSELVSQAVMGTPLILLEHASNGWWLAETSDSYRGWMIDNALVPLDSLAMRQWHQRDRVLVTSAYTTRIYDPQHTPVSDVNAGSILEILCDNDIKGDSVHVLIPDGRHGFLPKDVVIPLNMLTPHDIDTSKIIDMAHKLMGVAYLWGGTTTMAMDCSGLSKICYLNQGVILPRDASQQALVGKWLGDDYRNYRQGDLVFFKSATTGNIIHVGIYDSNGLYIHCAGRVKVNSLDPVSRDYDPSNILAGACRISGYVGTPGISTIN